MSLLSDLKFFLKKYLKNPILVTAAAYILWKYISKHKMKESLMETIKILDDSERNDYSIIFDDKVGKYILIYDNKVFSGDNEDELRLFLKKLKGE